MQRPILFASVMHSAAGCPAKKKIVSICLHLKIWKLLKPFQLISQLSEIDPIEIHSPISSIQTSAVNQSTPPPNPVIEDGQQVNPWNATEQSQFVNGLSAWEFWSSSCSRHSTAMNPRICFLELISQSSPFFGFYILWFQLRFSNATHSRKLQNFVLLSSL